MPDAPGNPSHDAGVATTREVAPTQALAAPGAGRLAPHDPHQIGPYRILERIGEGGMGIIYRAEQRQPIRREVAIKVIKLGMDTREVIARFDAERQALAMLAHPNVAKVLDAGMTDNGRPFFAMEYVAGVPLNDYCDQKQLSTRRRLELFIPICQAVQHAHQKGIIHRDLKPGNILVTVVDGRPVPKVIDFGIAKATNSQLTQQTLFTQTGAMIGTPGYMSPEQAKSSGMDVDTRTDVYSLGVILYELLTGTLPFDPQELCKAGIDGIARIIRDTEPHKPSTRVTLVNSGPNPDGNREQIARRHQADPKTLRRELRGDLDWIVLKAMEKDPTRRYQTASALSADVQRYLDDEPITARPPSTAYRLSKLMRRHKVAFAAAVLIVASLVAGLAGTLFELRRAQHERDNAMLAQLASERAKTEAMAANAFMRDLVASTEGTTDSSTRLAEAVQRLDDGWLADQPDTAAGCRIMLAHTFLSSGSPAQAEQQFQSAMKIARTLGPPEGPRAAAAARRGLGAVSMTRREFRAAATDFEAALANYRTIPGAQLEIAAVDEQLALARHFTGDVAGARLARIEGLKARLELVNARIGARPADAQLVTDRAFLYIRLGEPAEALDDFNRAVALDAANSLNWYYLASMQLYLKDDAAYRATASRMLQRFGRAGPRPVSARVALTCLLSPTPVGDVRRLHAMLDPVVQQDVTRPNVRWFALWKALAEYRAGDFTSALQWATRAQGAPGQYAPIIGELLGAMSSLRAGNATTAHAAYRGIVQRMDAPLLHPRAMNGTPLNVSDYVVCQILRREADALFAGRPASQPSRQ